MKKIRLVIFKNLQLKKFQKIYFLDAGIPNVPNVGGMTSEECRVNLQAQIPGSIPARLFTQEIADRVSSLLLPTHVRCRRSSVG